MKEKLQKIREEAIHQIESSGELGKLNDVRVAFLGKKGELTAVLKGMKDVAPKIVITISRYAVQSIVK